MMHKIFQSIHIEILMHVIIFFVYKCLDSTQLEKKSIYYSLDTPCGNEASLNVLVLSTLVKGCISHKRPHQFHAYFSEAVTARNLFAKYLNTINNSSRVLSTCIKTFYSFICKRYFSSLPLPHFYWSSLFYKLYWCCCAKFTLSKVAYLHTATL